MDESISTTELQSQLQSKEPPLVIDVRRKPAFIESKEVIAGALYRDPEHIAEWATTLPRAASVVVYCVHGHQVSQGAAKTLNERGITARFLDGGVAHWIEDGGAVTRKPAGAHSRWVTRERPKIDRIACPWLIARFVDRDAQFLYVPTADVKKVATERDAIAYDVPDVHFTHDGEHCSFDAFIKTYRLGSDPALAQLAHIVRGADTGNLALAPQAPGLLAVSLGLSRLYADDHEMLKHGMVMYDALYSWCKEGQSETHTWNPDAYR
ncbi:MAG: sulfurtransferase [Betaproteobacteria bacterium]|nr:sulfurtransferase [Betaproteobacteria bacterium]